MHRLLCIFLLLSGCKSLHRLIDGGKDILAPVAPAPQIDIPNDVVITGSEVWVLMGQSNMTGTLETQFPPLPHITMVYSSAHQAPYPQPQYSGPSLSFAAERVKKGKEVTLLQCSVGGTRINRWVPAGDLFGQCTNLMAQYPNINGVLFSQGENDTDIGAPWRDQFTLTVDGLRGLLGNVPIIFTQLGPNPGDNPFYDQIKQEQANVFLPNVFMVKQDDLAVCGGWHFCQSSYIIIGQRMAGVL